MEHIVIVIDLGNYKTEYQEKVPFKGVIFQEMDGSNIRFSRVKSLATGKEYELYHNQILEGLEIEEIVKLIDLSKYGT